MKKSIFTTIILFFVIFQTQSQITFKFTEKQVFDDGKWEAMNRTIYITKNGDCVMEYQMIIPQGFAEVDWSIRVKLYDGRRHDFNFEQIVVEKSVSASGHVVLLVKNDPYLKTHYEEITSVVATASYLIKEAALPTIQPIDKEKLKEETMKLGIASILATKL